MSESSNTPLSDTTNSLHSNTSTKSLSTELQRTAHMLSTYNNVSTKYGNKSYKHWKYGWLSSGHTEHNTYNNTIQYNTHDSSTQLPDYNKSTTSFYLIDDTAGVQLNVAAGLGYGNKHATHYTYTAPIAQTKRLSTDHTHNNMIYNHTNSSIDQNIKIDRPTQVLNSQSGYGRKSAYKFSAFAPR